MCGTLSPMEEYRLPVGGEGWHLLAGGTWLFLLPHIVPPPSLSSPSLPSSIRLRHSPPTCCLHLELIPLLISFPSPFLLVSLLHLWSYSIHPSLGPLLPPSHLSLTFLSFLSLFHAPSLVLSILPFLLL